MSEKRFTTNGYYINDAYHDGRKWLVNEVEAEEIVDIMNGLDTKARESRKAISKLQKENEQLKAKASSWKITASKEGVEKIELVKQISDLRKENEQLRQTIKEYEYQIEKGYTDLTYEEMLEKESDDV